MPSPKSWDPAKEVPDLSGKVILITGGTNGLGKGTVLELARHNPAHIYFTGRNAAAASAVTAEMPAGVKATFVKCDLASLASVKEAADEFLRNVQEQEQEQEQRLDVFIANAGVMATDAGLTADGFENQFGVNHVGPAALLFRLLPLMRKTALASPASDVRFVALTSTGYRGHPAGGIDFAGLRTTQEDMRFGTWGRYGQSKLANVLLAAELARRCPEIASAVVHPGVIFTGLVTGLSLPKRLFVYATNPMGGLTPEQGIRNTLWAATAKGVRDKFKHGPGRIPVFLPVGVPDKGDAATNDAALAKKLWEWTEEAVGVKTEC